MTVHLPKTLPSIDVKGLLSKLNNDREMFWQLLREFKSLYAQVDQDIQKAIDNADLEHAKYLTHTLKGVAGNILAKDLHASAIELENALHENDPNILDQKLQSFSQSLQEVVNSISELEKEQNGLQNVQIVRNNKMDSLQEDSDKLASSFVRLANLLQNNDFEAEECLREMETYIHIPDVQKDIERLEEQISQFNYRSAQSTLAEIASELNIPLEESRNRILIVDDSQVDAKILANALKSEYQVSVASSGKEALNIAFSKNPPSLILLDIMMPYMSGYQVCEQLKQDKRTRDIPVIFITAKRDEEDETRGLQLGAVDYITKPYTLPIVRARVKTHMELKQHRDLLETLSTLDALTGIPNRRRLDNFLEMEWMRAIRDQSIISLIIIDIDHFKAYNDRYGHTAGDLCLKKVAKVLTNSLKRPSDLVARFGGEEFVTVLPDTEAKGAIFLAELMRKEVEALGIPHETSPISDHVTISLGGASMIPARDSSPDGLLECADKQLYEAKKSGRNQLKFLDLTTTPEYKEIC